MIKVLVFDIMADYACFKKYFTTSSVLTYDIPPKTSLIGLVGAILGFNRKTTTYRDLDGMKIGITLLKPVEKTHQSINWLNTRTRGAIDQKFQQFFEVFMKKSPKDGYGFFGVMRHKPSNIQLLKDPKYRIYLAFNNSRLFTQIVDAIKNQCYHFTPYLGQSEFLCLINYIGVFETDPVKMLERSKLLSINSVIPQELLMVKEDSYSIEITEGTSIIIDNMPFSYKKRTTVFQKMLYNKLAIPISARVNEYFIVPYKLTSSGKDENVVLF